MVSSNYYPLITLQPSELSTKVADMIGFWFIFQSKYLRVGMSSSWLYFHSTALCLTVLQIDQPASKTRKTAATMATFKRIPNHFLFLLLPAGAGELRANYSILN